MSLAIAFGVGVAVGSIITLFVVFGDDHNSECTRCPYARECRKRQFPFD